MKYHLLTHAQNRYGPMLYEAWVFMSVSPGLSWVILRC